MKEVSLPSGAVLKVQPAPFKEAKEFYQAVLRELRDVSVKDEREIDMNLVKDLFCAAFASKAVDAALEKCMKKCLYNDSRITDETWETEDSRQDYLKACIEVAKENILPFVKSLSAEFSMVRELLRSDQALRQATTPS